MADLFPIGGIKLSGELTQIDLQADISPGNTLVALLQNISGAKIAISHLHSGGLGDVMQTTLSIAGEEFLRLQATAVLQPADAWCRIAPATGTLMLYPHGGNLILAAAVLRALALAGIPVHGLSSSVSALAIHTDYSRLDDAAAAVLTVCSLPENHTPLRPVVLLEGREVETAAVYWEPMIRIYGMDVECNLPLVRLDASEPTLLPNFLTGLEALLQRFRFLELVVGDEGRWSCSVLGVPGRQRQQPDEVGRIGECLGGRGRLRSASVDLVSFHGPHFQERYGIAALALAELQSGGVEVRAAGCTGTSVQILVAKGEGDRAGGCLRRVCEVPSGSR